VNTDDDEKDLQKDFPSLKLGYEQVNDALKDQVETVRDYENRAITLFSVTIAVLGIGMPLLLTKAASQSLYWLTASLIPIILFVFVYLNFWKTYRLRLMKQISDPEVVISEFIELETQKFYSDMVQHINEAFAENEVVLRQKEKSLRVLIAFTLGEVSSVVVLALLFFSFGLL
jgi:hypothetical protein